MRSMIVDRLHRLFGDEVPVYPTEVHDFEWNFEASPFLGPFRGPMAEVSVATHPIPPEREGHGVLDSPSTRTVSAVYLNEVHNSEASLLPNHLQVPATEVSVATYPIPPEREGHGLLGSPSTRTVSPVYLNEVHNFENSEASPLPNHLQVPTTEVSVATYPIPPEREGHELSGSPSTRREERILSMSRTSLIIIDIMSLT